MAINKAFLGHGIFVQLRPIDGLRQYANYKKPLPPDYTTSDLVDRFIEAVHDMKMSSVWVELFSSYGTVDPDGKYGTRELVAGLKAAKLAVVPWGYCFGTNSENPDEKKNDLERAKRLCGEYKLDLFVADVEPWNDSSHGKDKWKPDALTNLMKGLNAHFKTENLGLSSFANLDDNVQPHARELLPPVAPLVSFCAPQIYWNKADSVDWAKKSLQSWRNAGITTELVATVQCYWQKGEKKATRLEMEASVKHFIADFPASEWSKIVGLNWYHAGKVGDPDEGTMSQLMIDAIVAGNLDQKPYNKPPAAGA